MTARAAVFNLLTTDPVLTGLGITANRVFPNASLDVAPRGGHFLVLRWEEEELRFGDVGWTNMTVWCHIARQESRDYGGILRILGRVKKVLTEALDVPGDDGYLTTCRYQGMSADFNDETLKTIVKNAAFRVLERPATVE